MADELPFADDHREVDLGRVAAISDRGRRHSDNQDAFGLEDKDDRVVVAVCDGVSSSWRPDLAAAAAAAAATGRLRSLLEAETWPGSDELVAAIEAAALDAEQAVMRITTPENAVTATTIVLGALGPGSAAVGSIGDSRAYWIDAGESTHQVVTVDDSWAEFAIRDGLPAEQAYSSPHAHVITRCLRSDSATPTPPNVSVLEISGPGTLLVCTDGLWNYAPQADALAHHVGPEASARKTASKLVQMALDAGGGDNVTVAVIPAGPDGMRAV
jgi:serine/threonine protein phosphatase PrpC